MLVAREGEYALSIAEKIVPDVILMDALMPGTDGFAACRKLKQNRALAHVPVIFMTGLTDTEHIIEGLEAGGVDYISKPIVPSELLARIRVHLANARMAHSARAALDAFGRFSWRQTTPGGCSGTRLRRQNCLQMHFQISIGRIICCRASFRGGAPMRRGGAELGAVFDQFEDPQQRDGNATGLYRADRLGRISATADRRRRRRPNLAQAKAYGDRARGGGAWIARGKSNRESPKFSISAPGPSTNIWNKSTPNSALRITLPAAALAVRTIGIR